MMTFYFVDFKRIIFYRWLIVKLLFKILVAFMLIFQLSPTVDAAEISRKEIYSKILKAIRGEGEPVGPIIAYDIDGYDKTRKLITIRYLQGEKYATSELQIKTLPVIFLMNGDEDKIISFKEKNRLDVIYATGYIDTQYECFVCLEIVIVECLY